MEKQNQPSKDSTTPNDPKTPPSSPQNPPPTDDDSNKVDTSGASRSTGETKIMKTALQVLAELASSESSESHEGGGNGGGGGSIASGGGLSLGGGSSGGTSLALAVGSGPVAVVQEPAGGEGRGKKRKGSDVKDPPSGTPSCPVCFKEFSSWKGAFGHMRKHPDRDYRGFYKPPVSTPSSAARGLSLGGDQGESGEKNKEGQSGEGRSSSPIRGLVFDLNQQPMDGAGSSSAAEGNEAPHADQERIVGEGQKGFDLNELPPNEDDE